MMEAADDAGATARIHRIFIDVNGTPMHVRWAGRGIPVLLVPQSPTSARVLENRLHAFADRFLAIAPDIPGMGQSGTIAEPVPTIGLLARYFLGLLDALGIPRAILYGAHTGALICTEIARRHPERVAATVLDGYPIYTEEESAQRLATYFPDLVPGWDGAHLVWLWHRYREQFLYWPWNTKRAATRAACGLPDPAWLQAGIGEMARTHDTYPKVYAAAFSYAAHEALRDTQVETHFLASDADSLTRKLGMVEQRTGLHHLHPISGGSAAQVAAERRILDDIAGRNPGLPVLDALPPGATSVSRAYAASPGGALVALHRLAGEGRPAIVLPPVPAGTDFLLARPDARTSGRELLLVDPPGVNGVPAAPIGESIAAIAAIVRERGLTAVDLVAFGWSAALLPALCDALGLRRRRIVAVDAPVEPETPTPFDATLCPSGGHLLRFWDRWRFDRLFSPATTHTSAAIRRGVDEDLATLAAFSLSALSALQAWPAMEAALRPHATGRWIATLREGDALLFTAVDSARAEALAALPMTARIVDLSASGESVFAWLRGAA